MYKNIFLDTLNKSNKDGYIPIWLMRQAGRYLPEYRSVRGGISKFLDLCYNPELACKVTLQPIERFAFDAAIIFSDILVVPDSMGCKVSFETGEGPVLEKIENEADLKGLKISKTNEKFEKIWKTVSLIKKELPEEVALIGFAGSPWTVATYMLEGRGGKNSGFEISNNISKNNPVFLNKLIDIIIKQTLPYLEGQIDAGANVIQLFDSWAGILDYKEYKEFVEKPNKILVEELRKTRPGVPIICFPKGIKTLEEFVDNVKPDALSIGYEVDLNLAKKLQEKTIIQGNLDPEILSSTKERIKEATENILEKLSDKSFIFNLGHGILPETPVENVEFLVDLVRQYEKNSRNIT
jgi:uroporphyrinogen decarboxylase